LLENGDEQLRQIFLERYVIPSRAIQRSIEDAIASGELKRATDRLRRGMVGCNDYANVRRPVSGIE
jgi:hypothetical protein